MLAFVIVLSYVVIVLWPAGDDAGKEGSNAVVLFGAGRLGRKSEFGLSPEVHLTLLITVVAIGGRMLRRLHATGACHRPGSRGMYLETGHVYDPMRTPCQS